MKHLLLSLLFAAFSAAVVTGCGRSEKKPEKALPVLPAWDEDDDLPPEPEEDAPPVNEDDPPPDGEGLTSVVSGVRACEALNRYVGGDGSCVLLSDGMIVAIDSASAPNVGPKSANFHDTRAKCLQQALKKAKFNFAAFVSENVSEQDDGTSLISVDMNLSNLRVTKIVESTSPDNSSYEAAIALFWMENQFIPADAPLSKEQLKKLMDGEAPLVGPVSFRDDKGHDHFLGFGIADAGQNGAKTVVAKSAAKAAATQFATFFLPSHIVAERKIASSQKTGGNMAGTTSETLQYNETLLNGRVRSVELFSGKVVQPISRRAVLLSVVEVLQ